MRKQKQNQTHKKLRIVSILLFVVVVAACLTAYYYAHDKSKTTISLASNGSINYGPPSVADNKLENQTKSQVTQNTTNGSSNPAYSSSNPASLSVVISRISQSGSGQDIQVRTVVYGATTGQCALVFSQTGQQNISVSYPITFAATSSSCSNSIANIPASTFPTGGVWSLSITASSGSSQSPLVTGSVDISL